MFNDFLKIIFTGQNNPQFMCKEKGKINVDTQKQIDGIHDYNFNLSQQDFIEQQQINIQSMKSKTIRHSNITYLNRSYDREPDKMKTINQRSIQESCDNYILPLHQNPKYLESPNHCDSLQNSISSSQIYIGHQGKSQRRNIQIIVSDDQMVDQCINYSNNQRIADFNQSNDNGISYINNSSQEKQSYFIPQQNHSLKWLNKKMNLIQTPPDSIDNNVDSLDIDQQYFKQLIASEMIDEKKDKNTNIPYNRNKQQRIINDQQFTDHINNRLLHQNYKVHQQILIKISEPLMDIKTNKIKNNLQSSNQSSQIQPIPINDSQNVKQSKIQKMISHFKLQAQDFESGIQIVDIRKKNGSSQSEYQWILANKKYWKTLSEALQKNFELYVRQNAKYKSIFKRFLPKRYNSNKIIDSKRQQLKIQKCKKVKSNIKLSSQRVEIKQIFNHILMTKFIEFETNMSNNGIKQTRANLQQDRLTQYVPDQHQYLRLVEQLVEKVHSSNQSQQKTQNVVKIIQDQIEFIQHKYKHKSIQRQLIHQLEKIDKGFNVQNQVNQFFNLNKRLPTLACLSGGLGLRSTQSLTQICKEAFYKSKGIYQERNSDGEKQYFVLD